MHTKLFLTSVLAASVSASVIDERDLQACGSAVAKVSPLLTEIPTPAPTLARFIAQQEATITDQCQIPAITGSMAAEATSYFSTLSKWYDDHKKDFSDVLKACDDVAEVKEELEKATVCSSITWAKVTGTSSDTKPNAAPGQAGMAIAAGVVAGMAVLALN